MAIYTRRQLVLLLAAVVVAGAGIAIDRWRVAHPDEVERLESFDRRPAPPAPAAPPPAAPRPRGAPPATAAPADIHPAPPLDLNRASRDDLERLPGIGPGLAARILEARERDGAFAAVDDLRRVRGIGRLTLERIRPLLTVATPDTP